MLLFGVDILDDDDDDDDDDEAAGDIISATNNRTDTMNDVCTSNVCKA